MVQTNVRHLCLAIPVGTPDNRWFLKEFGMYHIQTSMHYHHVTLLRTHLAIPFPLWKSRQRSEETRTMLE